MNSLFLSLTFAIGVSAIHQPILVRFHHGAIGQNVTVCLDGQTVETTFAGKLVFQDENNAWTSVCADVRSPVSSGQFYNVRPWSSAKFGGNVGKAGNIVAKYFNAAQTPDQCAGLQIAVWKALEDGADYPSFTMGRFQVQASPIVMSYAAEYYKAADENGNAIYLQTQSGAGGGSGAGGDGGTGGQGQLTSGESFV